MARKSTPESSVSQKLQSIFWFTKEGGPGFCQFAINNACNGQCRFCGFGLNKLPPNERKYVPQRAAIEAIDILYRYGIRYLVITGGEPLLHRDLDYIIRRASGLRMTVLLVTNGSMLFENTVHRLANAGVTTFIISIDAATAEKHEANRGLPGVCERIRQANQTISTLKLRSIASTTMSRLVDYDALPDFLRSLGFSSVTFSYPLTTLGSSFLGHAQSELIDYTTEELLEAFDKVRRLKKRFHVVNPRPSLDEMKRFLCSEEQLYPCLGGFKYFYLDWNLDLWRCHFWEKPMCSIYDFDGSQRVRDGCTKCLVDCYRDASVLHHIAMSFTDALRSLRSARFGRATHALFHKGNLGSIRALLEEFQWILHL